MKTCSPCKTRYSTVHENYKKKKNRTQCQVCKKLAGPIIPLSYLGTPPVVWSNLILFEKSFTYGFNHLDAANRVSLEQTCSWPLKSFSNCFTRNSRILRRCHCYSNSGSSFMLLDRSQQDGCMFRIIQRRNRNNVLLSSTYNLCICLLKISAFVETEAKALWVVGGRQKTDWKTFLLFLSQRPEIALALFHIFYVFLALAKLENRFYGLRFIVYLLVAPWQCD